MLYFISNSAITKLEFNGLRIEFNSGNVGKIIIVIVAFICAILLCLRMNLLNSKRIAQRESDSASRGDLLKVLAKETPKRSRENEAKADVIINSDIYNKIIFLFWDLLPIFSGFALTIYHVVSKFIYKQ